MTEKEREFKIKSIQKYNQEIDKQKTGWNLFMLGAGIFLALGSSAILSQEGSFDVDRNMYFLGQLAFSSSLITLNGRALISKLAKKANLEVEVEKLQNELEMDAMINSENYVNEEERGHSR